MSCIKIIIYIILFFTVIQIIRQIFNIINSKSFPVKCNDYKRELIKDTNLPNILLLGDDSILGKNLFDCKSNLNIQLSDLVEANIFTYGKEGVKLRYFYDFIKTQWFDISKQSYDVILISIGYNDVLSSEFDIDSRYFIDIIKLLEPLTTNIFFISPYDIGSNGLFVIPVSYFINQRANKLYEAINNVTLHNNLKFIDIRKDIIYHCKGGRYCRIDKGLHLDENGYFVIARTIANRLNKEGLI